VYEGMEAPTEREKELRAVTNGMTMVVSEFIEEICTPIDVATVALMVVTDGNPYNMFDHLHIIIDAL
jgi:hypothetical protein